MKKVTVLAKKWYGSTVEPFELIKDNFGSLVGYEIIFRVLAFLVLFPVISWAEKLWLVGNKTNVIADLHDRSAYLGHDGRTVFTV